MMENEGGKIKRTRWLAKDIQTIVAYFESTLHKQKVPSNDAMRRFLNIHLDFPVRKLNTLRAFLTRVKSDPNKFLN